MSYDKAARAESGRMGGRPRRYPELSCLDLGACVVMAWTVTASGEVDQRAARTMRRAVQRAARRLGFELVMIGTGAGLRVQRTA